ncbi:MAG TPA: aminopeptidase, partial [Ginsengibacter sp.]|nr:aminopeptidase [Ginsengibacter sp.]
MNKRLFALSFALTGFILAHAQMPDQIINVQDVSRIEKTLSADEMEGRKIFTPGIEKAASFIESEFAKTGLGYLDGLKSYRQEFGMIQQKSIEISGDIDGKPLEPQWVAALGSEAELTVNEQSGFNQVYIDSLPNLF